MSNHIPSKPHYIFSTRIQDISANLDVIDASLQLLEKTLESKNIDEKIAKSIGITARKYKALNIPVKQGQAIINRTKRNNYEYSILILNTHFSEYLKNILRDMYDHKPLLIAGKASGTLQYHEIIESGSFDSISDMIVDRVFKKLESDRGTKKLLTNILKGTKVKLPDKIENNALMYIEIRHLLVHQSGKFDKDFIKRFGNSIKSSIEVNEKIPLTIDFVREGIKSVSELVGTIDRQLIEKGYLKSAFIQKKKNEA
jgi:hypothetical protein